MKRSLVVAPFLVSLVLAGCGGSSSSSAASRHTVATLTIVWPQRARLIPASANSIGITITKGGVTVGSALVARPADGITETSTDFTDLPAGSLNVNILAYPNADGTGVAQAAGGGVMTTAVDTPATITVSLVSTVTSLTLTPVTARFGKGLTTTVTASARDSDGNVVLLDAGGRDETLSWTSDTTSVATITGTGPVVTINGLTAGTTHIGASFVSNDSGATITATPLSLTVAATSGHVIVR